MNGNDILWTPLQYASALGKTRIVKFLIENGAEKSIIDSTGKNAKKIAEILDNKEILKIL